MSSDNRDTFNVPHMLVCRDFARSSSRQCYVSVVLFSSALFVSSENSRILAACLLSGFAYSLAGVECTPVDAAHLQPRSAIRFRRNLYASAKLQYRPVAGGCLIAAPGFSAGASGFRLATFLSRSARRQ